VFFLKFVTLYPYRRLQQMADAAKMLKCTHLFSRVGSVEIPFAGYAVRHTVTKSIFLGWNLNTVKGLFASSALYRRNSSKCSKFTISVAWNRSVRSSGCGDNKSASHCIWHFEYAMSVLWARESRMIFVKSIVLVRKDIGEIEHTFFILIIFNFPKISR